MADKRCYAQFRYQPDPASGQRFWELVRYFYHSTKPKNDIFDLENRVEFARVGSQRYRELLKLVPPEHHLPKVLRQALCCQAEFEAASRQPRFI